MPELAEVALYARDLGAASRGQRLLGISYPNQRDWGATVVPKRIQRRLNALIGERLQFSSAGKALYLHHRQSNDTVVEVRLGMTGCFHLEPLAPKWKRHCFLILQFEKGTLHYSDPRRFGRIAEPHLADLVLGGFNEAAGFWCERKPRLPKGFLNKARMSWLLGTGDETGVGNYMANEALGRLNLSPFLPCSSEQEATQILRKCADIAAQSFRHGGNSFGSGFYSLEGSEGRYSRFCRFYQNPEVPRQLFQKRPVFSHFSV